MLEVILTTLVMVCDRDIQESAIELDEETGILTISRTRPVNLTELFDYAHVRFHAEPDKPSKQRAYVPIRTTAQKPGMDDSYNGTGGFEFHMGVNYNPDTGRAEEMRVPLTTSFGEAYCENCFATVTMGIEYHLVRGCTSELLMCELAPSLLCSECNRLQRRTLI